MTVEVVSPYPRDLETDESIDAVCKALARVIGGSIPNDWQFVLILEKPDNTRATVTDLHPVDAYRALVETAEEMFVLAGGKLDESETG